MITVKSAVGLQIAEISKNYRGEDKTNTNEQNLIKIKFF